jgi:hypothetical protein
MVFGRKKKKNNTLQDNLAEWRDIKEGKRSPVESDEEQVDDSQCFVVTAVYGTPLAQEVDMMRVFRDDFLLKFHAGRLFVRTYYRLSPPVARFVSGRLYLRKLLRMFVLSPVVNVVKMTRSHWSCGDEK